MVLDEDSDVDIELEELPVSFPATLYIRYGFVDGLDLSADGLDSLLKLCHLDYYNTVFRLPCYSPPLAPSKFLLDHLLYAH